MERKLKTDLWKKACLIEFFEGKRKEPVDAFTFSVPPESEEITYSQRKGETKTFDGLHVDDYGLDAVKITLSGSTINQDLKKIYNPKKTGDDDWMTGEQEIYYLRDLIQKYKSGDYRAKEIKIMLYDLSKMNSAAAGRTAIKNYWRVFPGDFKIRRAADRPFTYKYSIEFTAVDEGIGEYPKISSKEELGKAQEALNKIKGFADYLRDNKFINILKSGYGAVNKLRDYLSDLNKAIKDVEGALLDYGYILAGYIDSAKNIADTANDIIKIPTDMSAKVTNILIEFMNAGKRLMKSVEAVSKTILSYFTKDKIGTAEFWAPREVLDEYSMTATEFADSWYIMLEEIEDAAYAIVGVSKSNNLPNAAVGAADPETEAWARAGSSAGSTGNSGGDGGGSGNGGGDGGGSGNGGGDGGSSGNGGGDGGGSARRSRRQKIILSYGDTEARLNSTDTLESLAARFLGSPDRAIDIAVYNGVASIDELNPGDTIKIPVLTPSGRRSLNRIYSRPEDRDNYGRDIYLNSEGCTEASSSGDYKLTGGTDNLNQAILLRLRESVNRRIRLVTYGIRANISDPTAGAAYIISSIDLTVKRDPRVRAVDKIKFAGAGDGLKVTVEYTDINHNAGSAAGRA